MSELSDLRAKLTAVEALVDDWKCRDDTCDGDCTGCAHSAYLDGALASAVGPKCFCRWRLSPPGLADKRIVDRGCPIHGST